VVKSQNITSDYSEQTDELHYSPRTMIGIKERESDG
jgi:hypothetical protein